MSVLNNYFSQSNTRARTYAHVAPTRLDKVGVLEIHPQNATDVAIAYDDISDNNEVRSSIYMLRFLFVFLLTYRTCVYITLSSLIPMPTLEKGEGLVSTECAHEHVSYTCLILNKGAIG